MINHARQFIAEFWPRIQATEGELNALIREEALRPVYQPIVELRNATIHGHEALIRGPAGSPLYAPDALFSRAQALGMMYEFELYCLYVALRHWGISRQPGRIFANISASALLQLVDAGGVPKFTKAIRELDVLPRMVVLEITEHERVERIDALVEVASVLHSAGLSIALDDFGDGHSSLRLWSQLKPDIVKIDKYFCRGISENADQIKTMRALLQIAETFGTDLIAEGIESGNDLRVVRDLGIAMGQGYFLGYPAVDVSNDVGGDARQVLDDPRVAVLPEQRYVSRRGQLRHLSIIHAPPLSKSSSNDDVAQIFQARPDLHAVAIVDGDNPVAIVNRQRFMDHYATLYFREVYGRKTCMQFANQEPRLIERNHDIEELIGILTSQDQRYLADGFIVTENGRYVGLGTGDQLVRSVTEMRLEAARHANPLTFLPGNIPISEHVRRLLDSGTEFTACYLDLNNFKPFNDLYGYWRGDEMIRLLARLAVSQADLQRDFVGHVGGDDFLILFQSTNWRQRCEEIIREFAAEARLLFDDNARERGGIEAEDRHGVLRFFPCTTVAIGAVPVGPGDFRDAEEVATRAALAKHAAKQDGAGLHVMEHARGLTSEFEDSSH